MFIGEYNHSLDAKGRMAVPAKFRGDLKSGAVVTRGIDTCLFVLTTGEWQKLSEKLMALPLTQSNSRAFVRLMLAGAMDVEIDSQGRILVPDYLRHYAGLKKEVVVTGLMNRLEIWGKEMWEKYKAKTESASEDIAEKLGEMGI